MNFGSSGFGVGTLPPFGEVLSCVGGDDGGAPWGGEKGISPILRESHSRRAVSARSPARMHGKLEAQSLGGAVLPALAAERSAAANGQANRFQLLFRLRLIDQSTPILWTWQWPSRQLGHFVYALGPRVRGGAGQGHFGRANKANPRSVDGGCGQPVVG